MSDPEAYYVTGMGFSQYVLGAERLGLPVRDLMRDVGLDPEESISPAYRVPRPLFERAMLAFVLHSGDELLGFHIGNQVMPALYGIFPSLALAAPTLRDALQVAVRYQALAGGNTHCFQLVEEGDSITASFHPAHANPVISRHVTDNIFSLLVHLGRTITGQQAISPQWVRLAHAEPSTDVRQAYAAHFQCDITYGASCSELSIPAATGNIPLSQLSVEHLHSLEELARKQLEEQHRMYGWLVQVQQEIRSLMLSSVPRRERVADQLHVSVRTLNRRLAEAGLTWQGLLDSMRLQLAREYLCDSGMTIETIAIHLGFSDVRSFQRRFRRWTGMTPTDFRVAHREALR